MVFVCLRFVCGIVLLCYDMICYAALGFCCLSCLLCGVVLFVSSCLVFCFVCSVLCGFVCVCGKVSCYVVACYVVVCCV